MARLMRGRKKRLILDIGASAIRLCELSQTKAGYQLTKYIQKEYNSDPSLDEEARKDLRQKTLDTLLKEAKVRTRKAIFAVPGQSVFSRSRTLPPVPEYKVNQIVRYEIQQQIPFGLDQIAMDYQVLERTPSGGYEVMMTAIKTDVVEKQLEVLFAAKRTVDVVDVSPLAAYNWLKHAGEFGDQGDCVALVDMGASTTDIVIERENQFRFTRPLTVGGNDITKALAASFAMNFSDAERLKRERGFAPTGDPQRDGKGGEAIGGVLQRMVSEIMRSFAYFRSLPGGGQVNRVVLCGGGACLRNIIPYLQRQLGIEVRIAQPLAGLAIAPPAQQAGEAPEQSSVVLGLALRCCTTVPLEINLVPPRVLEAARRKEQAFYWALSLTALAMIMATVIPVKAEENKVVRQNIDQLRKYISLYDPKVAQSVRDVRSRVPESQYALEYESAKFAINSYKNDVKLLDQVREGRQFWIDELLLINELRPTTGGMWFSSVETRFLPEQQNRQAHHNAGAQQAQNFPGLAPTGMVRSSLLTEGSKKADHKNGGGGMQVMRPNALVLNGYAESYQIVKSFVETLSGASRMLPNRQYISVKRVDFSEASVQKAPWSVLYNAPANTATGGQQQSSQDAGAWNPETDQSIYSFALVVEFEQTKEKPKAANSPQGAGGSTPQS